MPSSHSFCTDFFGFSPGNAGKNYLLVRSGFLRPFSGKFSGANFCFKVSISALQVSVSSSHSFCTDFFGFSPGNAGEKLSSCQVWFSVTFFRENFRERTFVSRSQYLLCVFWCLLAVVSAHMFSAFLPEMLLLVRGLVFCNNFRVHFLSLLSCRLSSVLVCSFWVESAAGASEGPFLAVSQVKSPAERMLRNHKLQAIFRRALQL